MTYSTNPKTLWRIINSFDELLSSGRCRWTLEPDSAARWVYKIREGLKIAEMHPQHFPKLAVIAPMVRVRRLSPSIVEAEVVETVEPSAQPVHLVSSVPAMNPVDAVEAYAGLIPATLHHVVLTDRDKDTLRKLAALKEPPVMLLYSSSQQTLTIAPDDPSIPEEAKL